jgi:hypothetical protein
MFISYPGSGIFSIPDPDPGSMGEKLFMFLCLRNQTQLFALAQQRNKESGKIGGN